MIKLFRNIRQQFLSDGKTVYYLKYAVGEIILVVIGILIALQVNNWNEERLKNRELNKLIADVDEYTESLTNSNRLYNKLASFDSLSRIFAYEEYSNMRLDHLANIEDLFLNDLSDYPYSTIRSDHFVGSSVKSLLDRKQDLPSNYWNLIYSLEILVQAANEFEIASNKMYQLSNKHYDYFLENGADLLLKDSTTRLKAFNTLTKDPIFQLRMRQMHLSNHSVIQNLDHTMGSVLELNSKIKYLDFQYKKDELMDLAEGYGLKPFKALNCDINMDVELSDAINHFIFIANTSDEDLIISMPNKAIKRRNLPRGFIGHIFIQKGDRIQVKINDRCIESFECTGRNYLIY